MKARRLLGGMRPLAVLAGFCRLPHGLAHLQSPSEEAAAPGDLAQDGTAFYLKGLRIPGTRQELRLREGGALMWVPLEQVSAVRFTGPVQDTYRQAAIILTGGKRLQGEV